MFIIVMKILIHICNQIFCPIPIRNTLLLLLINLNVSVNATPLQLCSGKATSDVYIPTIK